jgi:hypothetical protein
MRETETNHHRLQEIRLLLKFHTQLASTDKITGLTINMRFSPAGQQQEIKTDNHSGTLENYKRNKQDTWNKTDILSRDLADGATT